MISKAKEHVMYHLDRITQDPGIMGGKACIRSMRVTVSMILNQLAEGRTVQSLLDDYPYLESEDIAQAMRYAAWRIEERDNELANR